QRLGVAAVGGQGGLEAGHGALDVAELLGAQLFELAAGPRPAGPLRARGAGLPGLRPPSPPPPPARENPRGPARRGGPRRGGRGRLVGVGGAARRSQGFFIELAEALEAGGALLGIALVLGARRQGLGQLAVAAGAAEERLEPGGRLGVVGVEAAGRAVRGDG